MKELAILNEQQLEKQSELIKALEKQNKAYEDQQESIRKELQEAARKEEEARN